MKREKCVTGKGGMSSWKSIEEVNIREKEKRVKARQELEELEEKVRRQKNGTG